MSGLCYRGSVSLLGTRWCLHRVWRLRRLQLRGVSHAAYHGSQAGAGGNTRTTVSRRAAAGGSEAVLPDSFAETELKRVDSLPIPETVKQNLYGIGVTKLTEIQARAFHPILLGRSFVGRSKTGTGKTIAYLLPLLERMRQQKIAAAHSVVVLLPTRELCKQVGGTLLSLSVSTDVAILYGGTSIQAQEEFLRLNSQVIIATPGRCAQLIERGAIQVQNVSVVAIDEADAMLGVEYIGRVQRVLEAVTKQHLQGIIFSASMSEDVLAVVGRHFHNYQFVDLVNRGGLRGTSTIEAVKHRLCRVRRDRNERVRVLLHFLVAKLDELGGRCIVFVDSEAEASTLLAHPVLDRRARALHRESTPQDKDNTLTSFANREFDVLIATDVVARGVDFEDISLVLQLHPPRDASLYVHRAGRTGRAGSGGVCMTLYDFSERALVARMRELTRQKFTVEDTPDLSDLHFSSVSRLLDELLSVEPEAYEPILADAERLLAERGPRALATAMAVLDGRHASMNTTLRSADHESASMLSGRKGYICIQARDPDHTTVDSETDVRKILLSMLPRQAGEGAVGRVARAESGWLIDVSRRWLALLMDQLRSGTQSAPFELTVVQRMPRLIRPSRQNRLGALPWASLRRKAFRLRQRTVVKDGHKGPRFDGQWGGRRGLRKK